MKKIISIILMISFILSICITLSFAHPQDGKYNTCEENEKHAVENIEHYFVPEAYDVSPFTGYSYWEPIAVGGFAFLDMYCQDFYEQNVVYDDNGRISVPPMYTLFEPIQTEICSRYEEYSKYGIDFLEMRDLYYHGDNNRHNLNPSETMWQVLRDGIEIEIEIEQDGDISGISLDACIKAYLAPWTLYNEGELYTWIDLMKMNDDEINNLNFESYEFEKFIKNVKPELEKRGWWKEDYEKLYSTLSAHKDDYYNSQNPNEVFEFNGSNVYLSKMNEEYLSVEYPSITNIVSADIYQAGFMEEIYKLDTEVQEKYSELIVSLESGLESIQPSTGENTALYIAIAVVAVVAMTALVVRKKREIA